MERCCGTPVGVVVVVVVGGGGGGGGRGVEGVGWGVVVGWGVGVGGNVHMFEAFYNGH